MMVFTEGHLQIAIDNAISVRKFDDSNHGLSHCMKAVDFIIELPDRYLFVEFKDPDAPHIPPRDRTEFVESLSGGRRDEDFKYKYRDSFLYEWASGRADKPIYYLVLIAQSDLSLGDMTRRSTALEHILPQRLPNSVVWTRPIVDGCGVFNIESWNRYFPAFPVRRLP